MNLFTLDTLYQLQENTAKNTTTNPIPNTPTPNDTYIIILKLTARWCAPCKSITPVCHSFMDVWGKTYGNRIIFHEIDIDENPQFYSLLKKYKIVRGVPALLCYDKDKIRDVFPADMVNTGDKIEVIHFFNRSLGLL